MKDLTVRQDASIRDAITAIGANVLGIVFVVDADDRLVGTATDGDIRRGLLQGKTLDDRIDGVMLADCVALPVTTPPEDVIASFSKKIRVIPLVDEHRRVKDYATPYKHHRIPVASPNLDGRELEYVIEAVRSGWISSRGRYIREFEHGFAEYVGAPHAIAVSNGTVALHLALVAHGIGPGDEVIVPDLTFAATINVVLHAGATPVIVDVDRHTWNIDPERVAAAITPRTKAIMPVHLYGQPADMDALEALADKHGLMIIEDAAEALGSEWRGRKVGGLGHSAGFSFFANKTITTGEGGMLTVQDDAVAARARQLRDHGMNTEKRYWHDFVGFNYRMTNLQGAIGVAQLERVEGLVGQKITLAGWYRERLSGLDALELPVELPDTVNSNWAFSIVFKDYGAAGSRNEVMAQLARSGVETRPLFYPLHVMPPYRTYPAGPLTVSQELSDRGLTLPSSVNTTLDEVDYVCECLHQLFKSAELPKLSG